MDTEMKVNGREYSVIRLLGKGKGGYSYLVTDNRKEYVLKQIHHEPCDYYQFGNKLASEIRDHARLRKIGIRMPELLEVDEEEERILKEYIDGPTVMELAKTETVPDEAFVQIRGMCALLYANNTNIDYYPTNFILRNGELYYIDYECNDYMQEWDFEHWGIKYWRFHMETERLLIRRFIAGDADTLYGYLSDPQTVKFEPYAPMEPEEKEEKIRFFVDWKEIYAVELKAEHRLIGQIYVGDRENGEKEIGYVFDRREWGKHYASESCRTMIDALFSNGCPRITARCDLLNPASWRLLEALGFNRIALLEKNVFFWRDAEGNPIWKDTCVYEKTPGLG